MNSYIYAFFEVGKQGLDWEVTLFTHYKKGYVQQTILDLSQTQLKIR